MQKVLLISPHFDDAVLSAGQFMAGRPDVEVMTIFAGFPKDIELSEYDKKCGFKTSKDAVAVRRFEDREATAMLNATFIHCKFPDGQYNEAVEDDRIAKVILKQISKEDYEFIVAPLGLGHPDHLKVANIVRKLEKKDKIELPCYYWEDMPLRVIEPELVPARLKEMKLKELTKIGDGEMAKKIRALTCYKSQIGTGILDPYVMYVPERFWK